MFRVGNRVVVVSTEELRKVMQGGTAEEHINYPAVVPYMLRCGGGAATVTGIDDYTSMGNAYTAYYLDFDNKEYASHYKWGANIVLSLDGSEEYGL